MRKKESWVSRSRPAATESGQHEPQAAHVAAPTQFDVPGAFLQVFAVGVPFCRFPQLEFSWSCSWSSSWSSTKLIKTAVWWFPRAKKRFPLAKKKKILLLFFFLFWKTPTVGLILIPSGLFPSKVRTPTGNSNWTPTGLQLSSELDQFVIDLDAPGARSGSLSSRRISDGRQESSGGTNPYASAALRR